MNYYFYIDNQARYYFFQKIILSEDKLINCTFVVDLISNYFYLTSIQKIPVLFFTTNKWQKFLCKILKINYSSVTNFSSKNYKNKKFIFWNGSHNKKINLFNKRLNKNFKKIFIENANINNLFQYGHEGVGPFHEIISSTKNLENIRCSPKNEVVNILKNSKPSNLYGFARESYKRNSLEILLDSLFSSRMFLVIIKNNLYSIINSFFKKLFFKVNSLLPLKDIDPKLERHCILLQVHNDSSLINSGYPSYRKLIKSLIRDYGIKNIYLKPHPFDFLYALFLRFIFLNQTKIDYSKNINSLIKKEYKNYHTISSSYGLCLATNLKSNVKIFYYGKSPFVGDNSINFAKKYLINFIDLKKLIFEN